MIKITYHGVTKQISFERKKSILDLVRENFECSFSSCPGSTFNSGTCHRCKVKILNNSASTKQWKEVLACHTYAEDDMFAECYFIEEYDSGRMDIILDKSNESQNGENDLRGIACDLGSTTIAMRLGDETLCLLNPQRVFGADVISRISASVEGMREMIRDYTRTTLKKGFDILDPDKKFKDVIISGNTSMIHFLMGYDCAGLGCYPFEPVALKMEEFELGGRCVHTVPGISAFIGGDILSGIYYIEEKLKPDGSYILVDLGTNGEMVLKTKDKYYCCSSSAGPAFEGDVSVNLPGTDILHIVADGLRSGAIDNSGYLNEDADFTLKQQDIRNIQMAKAAIACGIETMLKEAAIDAKDVNCVYLAGGFGYYMIPEDAYITGLIPEKFRGRVISIGNSSLAGVNLMNKDDGYKLKLDSIKKKCSVISLSERTDFNEMYIDEINFKK